MMNIQDLIADLQEIEYAHGNLEVRLATQPSWPLEYGISNVCGPDDIQFDCPECYRVGMHTDGCSLSDKGSEMEPVVYIAEGGQIGYLPGTVADSAFQ